MRYSSVGLDFGLGLWRLHIVPGLYFVGYFQLIFLDSTSLAIQSHGLLTWTAIAQSDLEHLIFLESLGGN
jgi:hypothetical protein